MFSDLKKGFQVHTLDTNTVPKYELGKVVAVSEPRYLPPQPGQYQAMQTRVVDLTVELTGETKTYTVPESQNVAKAMGITLSTSIDPIMNELNAIKSTSQEIIDSVDAHRAKIEACESILEDINPAFKPPNEAADRLKKYLKLPRRGMTFEQALERLKLGRKIKRIDWGKKYICMFDVNILMVDTGQKVASNWNPTEHDIMSNDWEIAG